MWPVRRIRRTTELTHMDSMQSIRTHMGILVIPRTAGTVHRISIRMATWQITRQRFRKFRPTRAVITIHTTATIVKVIRPVVMCFSMPGTIILLRIPMLTPAVITRHMLTIPAAAVITPPRATAATGGIITQQERIPQSIPATVGITLPRLSTSEST